MKKWAIFLVLALVLLPMAAWALSMEEKETEMTAIGERFVDYMTALKFQEWDNAYTFISSHTNKGTFVEKMSGYWGREGAPKIIEFRIDKITLNDYGDKAKVSCTEKLSVFNKKTGWTEVQSPIKQVWIKEADGLWYRDYK